MDASDDDDVDESRDEIDDNFNELEDTFIDNEEQEDRSSFYRNVD